MKNLVIVLLLVTNFFLGALVLSQEVKIEGQEHEARELAVEFITQRGISVQEEIIPKDITLVPQEMRWNRQLEGEHAVSLLGIVNMESLGGDIVRYFNDSGELRFHGSGEFYARFHQPIFQGELGEEEQLGLEVLGLLALEGTLLQREDVAQYGSSTLAFVQTLEGVPLLGCEIFMSFQNGVLEEITHGKRLEGVYTSLVGKNISVATALVQCYHGLVELSEDCTTVVEIVPGYIVSTPLTASASLAPGWRVVTNEGEYYLNTLTGVLERGF